MPSKGLPQLREKLKSLEMTNRVELGELLNPSFISRYTRFSNIDELFENSGLNFKSPEEFQNIPQENIDAYIAEETVFSSFQEMIKAGGEEWLRKKMSIG